jgi:uncharacterized protein YdeI (YjbR/CyaY-like superfamily)
MVFFMDALSWTDTAEWRQWLATNGRSERSVWLVVHREPTGLNLPTAVGQALCFGWIDSKTVRRDAQTTYQCFTLATRAAPGAAATATASRT